MIKIRLNIFWKEALMFGATLTLGLFVAYQNVLANLDVEIFQPSAITLGDLTGLALLLVAIWLISRISWLADWMFWISISILVLYGSQIVIASFAPFPADIIGSLLVLIMFLIIHDVLAHDLAIILAIAGIGAAIGIMITPTVGIFVLVLLSFYDIVAVYKTKHMVRIAEGMIRSGAVFGFIIPSTFQQFVTSRYEARHHIGKDFMILGSGDIALPLIFACSLVRQSLPEAIIVAGFSVLGLFLTHILFTSQSKHQPMAALPPIATLTLIGYAVALLII